MDKRPSSTTFDNISLQAIAGFSNKQCENNALRQMARISLRLMGTVKESATPIPFAAGSRSFSLYTYYIGVFWQFLPSAEILLPVAKVGAKLCRGAANSIRSAGLTATYDDSETAGGDGTNLMFSKSKTPPNDLPGILAVKIVQVPFFCHIRWESVATNEVHRTVQVARAQSPFQRVDEFSLGTEKTNLPSALSTLLASTQISAGWRSCSRTSDQMTLSTDSSRKGSDSPKAWIKSRLMR